MAMCRPAHHAGGSPSDRARMLMLQNARLVSARLRWRTNLAKGGPPGGFRKIYPGIQKVATKRKPGLDLAVMG